MKVETRDLISQISLARRLGVNSSAISNWRNRHKTFPKPVFTDGSHIVLFRWPEVRRWLRSTTRGWLMPRI